MPTEQPSTTGHPEDGTWSKALESLVTAAAANLPGVDFVSVTTLSKGGELRTVAATDPLAERSDELQYALGEGPCLAAVNEERLVLVNDVASSSAFPKYGPQAARLGVRSQAAIQLVGDGERAGLNLYARQEQAFDHTTVQFAELFSAQAGALLGYAEQVEHLTEALHTRTDIGIAIGILMERYGIDRQRAFAFLVRNSNQRNIKLRELALRVVNATFESTPTEDTESQDWP